MNRDRTDRRNISTRNFSALQGSASGSRAGRPYSILLLETQIDRFLLEGGTVAGNFLILEKE